MLGLLAGFLAGAAVLLTLGHPGITIDEPIDVKVGGNYLTLLGSYLDLSLEKGLGALGPAQIDALFADNKQHPPLGRLLLGLATLASPIEPLLGGSDPFSVHSARLAPMLAFATLAGLITRAMARRYGPVAGAGAGLSLLLFPRSFAHAHFATLDTFLSLFWTAALLSADSALASPRPILPRMAAAGLLWGLALLTKIHAWLLPPLVALNALVRLRHQPRRLLAPLAVWAFSGLLLFFLGWPWLWPDPLGRLSAFLSTSVERLPLSVLYFGHVYADKQVPWHYPWVHFALAVPLGLHLLALVGLTHAAQLRRTDPLPLLLASSILEFLLLFSTSAPVYDGERLFLHVFPAWAMLAGLGLDRLWHLSSRRGPRLALTALLLSQAYPVIAIHPFGLSYYNALVGGLPGAERLGLELTYWGDALDRPLLSELERLARPGDRVAVVPTIHHLYPTALLTQGLLARKVALVPEQELDTAHWLLVSRRQAYWPPSSLPLIRQAPHAAQRSRQGVWLSRLIPLDSLDNNANPSEPFEPAKSFRTN